MNEAEQAPVRPAEARGWTLGKGEWQDDGMGRFTIRRYQPGDVEEVYRAADESREHVGRWMDWMTPDYSAEHARDWVAYAMGAWELGDAFEFVIVDSEDGLISGSCGLNLLNKKDLVCNLGYWVRKSKLGLGAALEVALQLKEHGFGTMGYNRLEIVVADGNEFSRRVAEKTGAVYDGLLRKRLMVRGAAHDAHLYGLVRQVC